MYVANRLGYFVLLRIVLRYLFLWSSNVVVNVSLNEFNFKAKFEPVILNGPRLFCFTMNYLKISLPTVWSDVVVHITHEFNLWTGQKSVNALTDDTGPGTRTSVCTNFNVYPFSGTGIPSFGNGNEMPFSILTEIEPPETSRKMETKSIAGEAIYSLWKPTSSLKILCSARGLTVVWKRI